jgi:hypothetical protein
VPVFVEYAGVVAAISLFAATLTGAYSANINAVFASGTAGVAAAGKAAHAQHVAPAGAKAAYKRAPYRKPALKYLYALGWIGGKKNLSQCGLTLLSPDAMRDEAARGIASNAKLKKHIRSYGMTARTAATALVAGVVSACD